MGGKSAIVVLASACSLVVGIGVGHWLLDSRAGQGPAPSRSPAASSPSESAELLSLLRELQHSVKALTHAVEVGASSVQVAPTASTREPLGTDAPSAADSGDLSSALRALSAAISGLHTTSGVEHARTSEELVTPAWVDRDAAFAATGLRQAAQSGGVAQEQAERAFRVKHLFKTNQQILSTYGAPDSISLQSNIKVWQYTNDFEGGGDEFGFNFDEGIVIEAWYRFSPGR